MPYRPVLPLLVLLLAGGCAHTQRVAHRPGSRIEMEPMKIEMVQGPGGRRLEAFDATTLFEQAGEDLQAQRFAEAAAGYDRLLKDFPDSRYGVPALYNAGLAYEGLKQYAPAAARYQKVAERKPGSKDALDALFRLGACYAELKNWPASLEVFGRVLDRKDLSLSDEIEAMSRKGLAQVEINDLPAAERTFRTTMDHFKGNEEKERLDSDFYLAMAQFYLAHIPHRFFRALPVRLPQRQLEQDIDAKAKMFLQAQSRYIETIKLQNPVWATAAGFQIGSLYKEMYDVLLNSPMPPELDTEEKRRVYLDVMRDRLKVLLEKARRIHEKNKQMAERIGVDNDWVRKSGDQLEELERLLSEAGQQGAGENTPQAGAQDKREAPPVPPSPGKRAPDYRPRSVL